MSVAFLHALWPRGLALPIAAAMLLWPVPALADEPTARTEAPVTAAAQPPDIEAFVREGCPHCASAEAFLATLGRERPELRIAIRDVGRDPGALDRLRSIATAHGARDARVPAILVRGELIVGYSPEAGTARLVREALARSAAAGRAAGADTCAAEGSLACTADASAGAEDFSFNVLGRSVSLDAVGLPLFTLVMGLLDGFNPCSMWVLILMISLLAPLNDRPRMLAIAGTFVLIQGIAYLAFMAAWLNLFLFIGLSRASELVIAGIAIVAGAINLKDFRALGRGITLSVPDAAKPGIYARMRRILRAENLVAALVGTVLLAILMQLVELLCTSGFPALYTRILTLEQLDAARYYGYLLLYIAAYMLDDVVVLAIGVITLSQRRLQEKEGRWLKLASGLAMLGLGAYLIVRG